MLERLTAFFSSDDFMPHGHCFLWVPDILWLHVISDALIACAYYSIPISLLYFIRKRSDLPFKWLIALFASFIMLCGTTHILGIWVIWHPDYAVEGVVKAMTAVVSLTTALIAWSIIPRALELKGPGEMRDLNTQLQKAYDDIEDKVEERTAELQRSQAELEMALSVAREASKAKSEFLANMSHEIRTPMNAVIGLSNILSLSEPLTEKQKDYVKTLQLSGASLLSLLNDLLDIAKIETNSFELEQTAFSVVKLLEDVSLMMSERAAEKGLTLLTNQKCACIEKRAFRGDPTRIRQILLNLCSNAIKFTEKGSVTIEVSCDEGGDQTVETVMIAVRDTGIGIAPKAIDTIFEKFVQGDSSINRKYGGSGLGLAITKTLAEIMGGTIDVESKLGGGSSFTVTLPLAVVPVHEIEDATPPLSGSEGPKKAPIDTRPRARVLIVEDHPANILVVSTFIESFGHDFDLAADGAAAVEKAKTGAYDAVLMDVQMPGMDGLEATRIIRSNEETHNLARLPVIGVTAHALVGDREKCLDAGMDDYITKPFDPRVLRQKLQDVLDGNVSVPPVLPKV